MTAGILSSIPRENLVFVPRRINGQLSPGERCIATGAVTQLTLPSPRDSRPIEILNNTGAGVEIAATLGATISGNNVATGAAFSNSPFVRLPDQGRAILMASGSNWIAVGCIGFLSFSYNGTPLASNAANPLSASDLFHYLGIVQGSGIWTNPANTAQLISAASSLNSGTVANFTDRVASGQNVATSNVAGSWMGWEFIAEFTCLGFWMQTRSLDSQHLRSFELRVSTGTGLTTGADITGWPVAQQWAGQEQITGANQYFFFPVATPLKGNRLAIRSTGPNSTGSNTFSVQEWNLFGVYEG